MYNCIFSAQCVENCCDKACPVLAEVSYLLERNNISMSSSVFSMDEKLVDNMMQFLDVVRENKMIAFKAAKTAVKSEQVTYTSILQNWEGSQLHCTVYSLKFQKYLDLIQKSWSTSNESSELQYMRIFISSCKVLIISGLDFVNFKDFQSQTLLTILQDREYSEGSTVIVLPKTELVGEGTFFNILKDQLGRMVNNK